MFESRQILASTLVKSGLKPVEINSNDKPYPKKEGVNCYAFATGRAPYAAGDDPIPGAFFLEHKIRSLILELLNYVPQAKEKTIETLKRNLKEVVEKISEIMKSSTDCEIKQNINKFTNHFFDKSSESLSEEENSLFFRFLTESYQVPTEYQNVETIQKLLLLDGLTPLQHCLEKKEAINEFQFGTHLLAAFVKTGSDYHFLRYFEDGWYERVGDFIRKRQNTEENKLYLIEKQDDITAAFPKDSKGSTIKDSNFAGYYLVPPTVELCDRVGRLYISEKAKIPLNQGGTGSTRSNPSSNSSLQERLSQPTSSRHSKSSPRKYSDAATQTNTLETSD